MIPKIIHRVWVGGKMLAVFQIKKENKNSLNKERKGR